MAVFTIYQIRDGVYKYQETICLWYLCSFIWHKGESEHITIHKRGKQYFSESCDNSFTTQGVWINILQFIQETNLMFANTVVNHIVNMEIWVTILELIQVRQLMLVNTVVNHFTYSIISLAILELIQERNHILVNTVVNHLGESSNY